METRHRAIKKNIHGWVRNTSDGKVEAVFEGEKEDVEQMIAFCRRGPSGATVTKVDVQWEEYIDDFKNFQIRGSNLF
jgi:acylphosphatase